MKKLEQKNESMKKMQSGQLCHLYGGEMRQHQWTKAVAAIINREEDLKAFSCDEDMKDRLGG